ncbi:uncharacterized protein EI97DRAFT_499895 [Westerdykella ornata]|uniref:Uncharacterized protein n=1 Tax=Westerdykella ornata TaxID=318751 RepID=A0A6A6JP91_WESOR|nr:uncharacterized protein EI97DRAFT_499895 [Westerdykella ornata]KAF2278470.1 hypothetical protein EI97DRAFT_499895 [Westerdykella ornata]
MNELVQLGNFPRSRLPQRPFSTASAYYSTLADIHLEHLSTQRNDAVESAKDCRRKYVARHLFRKLASEMRLDKHGIFESGPFKIFCDDLRPTNVLLNKDFKIVAVIDWEFTYAAPVGFCYSPPWWLLLETPEDWPWGLEDWEFQYERRLQTFLSALEAKEQESLQQGTLESDQILSISMRQSCMSGAFFVNYAARKSWAFDAVFFKWVDKRFFGDDGGDWLGTRLPLLTTQERETMEPFVGRKLAEAKERMLYDSSPRH